MGRQVKDGDKVEILYIGKLENGEVFDSTDGREPFGFVAGSHEVIPGMSKAVLGMGEGEKKEIHISPEEGYGEYREELLGKVPTDYLPENVKLGDPLADADHENQVYWVKELNDDHAILDGNHPLAGKTLVFDIEIVSIS
ncbi:MAG: FKBP-type peptidyl-prolyl cis-trans isomerase [Nitrospinota bacterium]|nr:FKBP-type peptidyl-prolyl cis-trans isomerase [Nitrospinota bacterium]